MEVVAEKGIDINLDVTHQILGPKHIESIIKLRKIVLSNLRHNDNYVKEQNEQEFILNHLGRFGDSIGFYHNGELIAYTAITYDIISANFLDEYKLLIGEERPSDFGAMAATLVHPDFQGVGIQSFAINLRLELAKEKGIKHLGTSISPHNNKSLKNLIKAGGEIRSIAHLSGSRQRFLLLIDVNKKNTNDKFTEVYVPLRKITLHDKILNEGYYGNNIIKTGFDSYISYIKNEVAV